MQADPDRALESFEEAHEFLRDRGLLTRTADSALPSLFEACHEEPYAAGSRAWFSWRWLFEEGLVERLVSEGRLERIEPGLVTAPPSG